MQEYSKHLRKIINIPEYINCNEIMIIYRLRASNKAATHIFKELQTVFANDLFQALVYTHAVHLLFIRTMKEKLYSLGSSIRKEPTSTNSF